MSQSRPQNVNGLICTTARLARPPKLNLILLDQADGLDRATTVRSDFQIRQLQMVRAAVNYLRFHLERLPRSDTLRKAIR